MNKRIQTISSYITANEKVIDVGCDQALLSEILANKNIRSIAIDIKKNIIENAKKRIKILGLQNYVEFYVSNGLDSIKKKLDSSFTIVVSGMGSHTILNILEKEKIKYSKIITISNNEHEFLRISMLKFGYKISMEEIIIDKNKFYNLIIFIPGNVEYSEEELLIGYNHQSKENLVKKLKEDLIKYNKIYNQSKNYLIKNKIEIIEKKLKYYCS